MAMTGYTKLFNSILASTIWREDDKTRLVWITLLAMTDKSGAVEASIPGLADLARVSIEDCERAIENLQKPDKYSRSQDHDGRRLERIDGGWLVLNHAKYRDKMSEDDRRERDRERQHRHRQSQTVTRSVTQECDMSRMSRHTDTDSDSDTATTTAISQQESLPDNSSSHAGRKKVRRKPPKESLQAFVGSPVTTGQPLASHEDAAPEPMAARIEGFNSTEVARVLCVESGWSGLRMIEALKTAIEFKSPEMPECSLEQVGEWLVKAFFEHEAEHGKFAGGPLGFYQQAKYPHSKRRPAGSAPLPVNDPVAYALSQMEGD